MSSIYNNTTVCNILCLLSLDKGRSEGSHNDALLWSKRIEYYLQVKNNNNRVPCYAIRYISNSVVIIYYATLLLMLRVHFSCCNTIMCCVVIQYASSRTLNNN